MERVFVSHVILNKATYVINKLRTSTFKSNPTKRTCVIGHRVNCKSKHVIYLFEYIKCKLQYIIGKSETQGNLRIKNHRKRLE